MGIWKMILVGLFSIAVFKSIMKTICVISYKMKNRCSQNGCGKFCGAFTKDTYDCSAHESRYSCGCCTRYPLWRVIALGLLFVFIFKTVLSIFNGFAGVANSESKSVYKAGSMTVIINDKDETKTTDSANTTAK